jgi:hypothetical protein
VRERREGELSLAYFMVIFQIIAMEIVENSLLEQLASSKLLPGSQHWYGAVYVLSSLIELCWWPVLGTDNFIFV